MVVILFKAITTLWVIISLFLSTLPLQPEEQAQLLLQNIPLQDEQLLVVTVVIKDVADLYGADIQLNYNPLQLRVRDENPRLDGIQVSPGPLLAFDDRFLAVNRVNPESGQVNFVFTLLPPAPPITGEGVLATVVFEILGDGPYSVDVGNAQLVASTLQAIPVTAQNLTLNGHPAPASSITSPATGGVNWRWSTIVLLISILVVLALFVLLNPGRKLLPATGSQATAPRKMSGSARSATHSAALLTAQGHYALDQGNVSQAYELFSRAIELDPANAEAWLGKGLVAQQDTEKLICLQRALALAPNNPLIREKLGK